MKMIILCLSLLFSFSALSAVMYPVKNFNYISGWDMSAEVERSEKFVVLVFSSKECLERSYVERRCFDFERKLDSLIPKLSRNIKVVGVNTFFENDDVVRDFKITKSPTVILMKDNQILKRYKPVITHEMFSTVMSELFRIR